MHVTEGLGTGLKTNTPNNWKPHAILKTFIYWNLCYNVAKKFLELLKMTSNAIKEKLLNEINLLPDKSLSEAYRLIQFIRLDSEKQQKLDIDLLSFSGAWKDMDDAAYTDLISSLTNRRNKAFKNRRNSATSIN